jgi:hypothetical protein
MPPQEEEHAGFLVALAKGEAPFLKLLHLC